MWGGRLSNCSASPQRQTTTTTTDGASTCREGLPGTESAQVRASDVAPLSVSLQLPGLDGQRFIAVLSTGVGDVVTPVSTEGGAVVQIASSL